MIDKFAFADVASGMTYRIAIFYDVFALGYIAKGKLMTCRDTMELTECHCYAVGRIYVQKLFHAKGLLYG